MSRQEFIAHLRRYCMIAVLIYTVPLLICSKYYVIISVIIWRDSSLNVRRVLCAWNKQTQLHYSYSNKQTQLHYSYSPTTAYGVVVAVELKREFGLNSSECMESFTCQFQKSPVPERH
jgi:hypothetical protein